MRIGLCTTDYNRALPAREIFGRISALGFETVQLAFCNIAECGFSASPHIEIPEFVSADALSAIKRAAKEYRLSIGAINGTWNMAHPNREIREEGLRRFDGFLAAVAELECPIVSLCSGTRSSVNLWQYDPGTTRTDAWTDCLDVMRRASSLAEKRGVILAIETEASNVVNCPEKARRIMDETGSKYLKMVLDAANLFHPGQAHPENVRPTLDLAMKYFGQDIVLAHGKDILPGDELEFCGAGFGILDFPYMIELLRNAGFEGDMMLHGICIENHFSRCLRFMQECIQC